jgi:hypothetical protein
MEEVRAMMEMEVVKAMVEMEVVRAMVDKEGNMAAVRAMVVDMAGKEVDTGVEGMAMIRDMHLLN